MHNRPEAGECTGLRVARVGKHMDATFMSKSGMGFANCLMRLYACHAHDIFTMDFVTYVSKGLKV